MHILLHEFFFGYWPPTYLILLCVSSHFWPFTIANLVWVNSNKNLEFGQTPPLVGQDAQLLPPKKLMAPLICKYIFTKMQIRKHKKFKYAAAMKCKVGPKFVKGGNVLLPYRWSLMEHMSKLHQLAPQPIHGQIFKNLDQIFPLLNFQKIHMACTLVKLGMKM